MSDFPFTKMAAKFPKCYIEDVFQKLSLACWQYYM